MTIYVKNNKRQVKKKKKKVFWDFLGFFIKSLNYTQMGLISNQELGDENLPGYIW